MKKFIICFIIIVIIIVAVISYIYFNYIASSNNAKRNNLEYTSYYDRELTAGDVASLINKAMNNNIEHNVEKDQNGNYNNNDNDSINIDIKFIDNDKTYRMETIYNNGTDTFMQYYNSIKFKCMKIDYHAQTGNVSYMYIEQASV